MNANLADSLGTCCPAVVMASASGIPVTKHPLLSDGKVVVANDATCGGQLVLWIGTFADEFDQAARQARLTVRRGLADVLAWLGEPVENEPTGEEIYAALMARAAT